MGLCEDSGLHRAFTVLDVCFIMLLDYTEDMFCISLLFLLPQYIRYFHAGEAGNMILKHIHPLTNIIDHKMLVYWFHTCNMETGCTYIRNITHLYRIM